jgi:hypothetical protein
VKRVIPSELAGSGADWRWANTTLGNQAMAKIERSGPNCGESVRKSHVTALFILNDSISSLTRALKENR